MDVFKWRGRQCDIMLLCFDILYRTEVNMKLISSSSNEYEVYTVVDLKVI